MAKFELGVRPKFLTRQGRESDNIGLTARKDFLTREGRGSGKIWVEREGFARERERKRQELRLRASAGGHVIPVASFAQTHCHRSLVSRIFFSSILLHLLYTHYWLPTKLTSILF